MSIQRKKIIRCGLSIVLMLSFFTTRLFAQDSLAIQRFDERSLSVWTGTTVVSDPTAHRGQALFRPSSTFNGTFWFGPYKHLQAGNYLVQVRLKVASNVSDSEFLNFNVVSNNGVVSYGVPLKPSMFRKSNEWQLFTLPIQIPENADYIEIRGTNFVNGITDLYMDYVTVMPGDVRGLYSAEYSIDGKGNVGIGTIDPKGYKLAVNGNIRAKEIKVEAANWPDYVFAKDYALPSLKETEKHIQEKGHLPGIPSAQEVKSSGVDLGEMNAKLLKKIEELTLYLIEMKKENESFKKDISELKITTTQNLKPVVAN